MGRGVGLVVLIAALAAATGSGAAKTDPSVTGLELVVSGLSSPVHVTAPPGDNTRLFIVQQGSGTSALIRLWDGDLSTFLTVTNIRTGGEEGLLSMAFHPQYATNRRFYVYYTNSAGNIEVAEYLRDEANPDIADPNTRRTVIVVPHPSQSNHNGGQLQFGPDGYLYMATGDGGGGGDPFRAAQNLEDLRGKIIRIDPVPLPAATSSYGIPADNPYVGIPGRDEIWARGLRNPWRFSFDRLTGDLTIGDVGQGSWEEIDFVLGPNAGRGVNFGWSCYEGRMQYSNFNEPMCQNPPIVHTPPVFVYSLSGQPCAVVGGYVVRDVTVPSLYGRYVYSDNCASGSATFGLRSIQLGIPDATDDMYLGLTQSFVTSFGEDAQGRVYVAAAGTGQVSRFVEMGSPPPQPPPPPPPPPLPALPPDVHEPACSGPRVVRVTYATTRRRIRARRYCRVGLLGTP